MPYWQFAGWFTYQTGVRGWGVGQGIALRYYMWKPFVKMHSMIITLFKQKISLDLFVGICSFPLCTVFTPYRQYFRQIMAGGEEMCQ